jgi:hypothetical protein
MTKILIEEATVKLVLQALGNSEQLTPDVSLIAQCREAITAIKQAQTQTVQEPDAASLFREALGFGWIYGPLIPTEQWNEMREEKVAQLVARLAIPPAPAPAPAQPAVPEGMVLVPYEPSAEMQEQGSTAAGYDLSQKRARYVYQSMIDMHVLREGAEPTDQWFRIQAGYTTPPAVRSPDHVGYFYFDEGQWKQASDPISFSNCTKLYTTPLYHPITTAPKDGTAILALLRYSDIPMPVRWKDGEWVATWDGYRVSELDGPTHWMSIPKKV